MTTKVIGWTLAVFAAAATAIYFATQGSTAPSTDLCIKDLPAPFNTQAQDTIKKGDAALMQSFAAQCDARGWHCAAKELRTAALSATSASDKAKHATADILDVAAHASEPLRTQAANVLHLFVRPKIGSMTGMDYKTVTFSKTPTDADIKMIDDLVAALDAAGYKTAHDQMMNAADAAREVKSIFAGDGGGPGITIAPPVDPSKTLVDAGRSIIPLSDLPEPWASSLPSLLASSYTKAATLRTIADDLTAAGYTGAADDLRGKANILALKESGGV